MDLSQVRDLSTYKPQLHVPKLGLQNELRDLRHLDGAHLKSRLGVLQSLACKVSGSTVLRAV